jgi:hypothetical protein
MSGYAPPAAIRLDEHAQAESGTAFVAVPASPSLTVVPVAPVAAAPPTPIPGRRGRVQLRTSVTILLFLLGVAGGVVGLRLASPARASSPDGFPSLDRSVVEPVPAGAVAQELVKNDVHGLAQLMDGDTLTSIQTALKPLITFESVTYLGATTLDHDTLAGYVVKGRDSSGNLGLVGLVIRIRDGQVVSQ